MSAPRFDFPAEVPAIGNSLVSLLKRGDRYGSTEETVYWSEDDLVDPEDEEDDEASDDAGNEEKGNKGKGVGATSQRNSSSMHGPQPSVPCVRTKRSRDNTGKPVKDIVVFSHANRSYRGSPVC
jgi:hypothetical protein